VGFPNSQVCKETILKEIKRLEELGTIEWQPTSELAAPSFVKPKTKEKWYCTIPYEIQKVK
jgi:hypothetical protein